MDAILIALKGNKAILEDIAEEAEPYSYRMADQIRQAITKLDAAIQVAQQEMKAKELGL